jgi:hypothetical protein
MTAYIIRNDVAFDQRSRRALHTYFVHTVAGVHSAALWARTLATSRNLKIMATIGYLFDNNEFSDIYVVLRESDEQGGMLQPAAGVTMLLPGHRVVLRAESAVLDAQVSSMH